MNRGITVDRELSKARHHGVNSTELAEKIVRERVFDSLYWKLYCFNINECSIMKRGTELQCIGTMEPSGRPFPFVCLLVKLFQLLPSQEIIQFFVDQEEFKYLKVLGLLYMRIVYRDKKLLLPHLQDYRKVRVYDNEWKLLHIDDVVDSLLNDGHFIGLTLPLIK
jgi:pre-mRNA-splicing factor 38A